VARLTGEVRRQVIYPNPGRPGFVGIVPAALDRMVTALLGVELAAHEAGRGGGKGL
jgi:hypothetical protein